MKKRLTSTFVWFQDGSQPFDDAADDSVVPSTPKLCGTQRSGSRDAPEGFSELPQNDPR